MDTDASDVGIGAVLAQRDDQGREQVVAYGSRLLSKVERKYCVTRRELLAAVVFTNQFRPYLFGRQFILRTDHGSLAWLRNFKEPEGQLARWLERLQELDFEIVHRQGRRHSNADALSRLPCPQCKRHSHDDDCTVLAVDFSAGLSTQELAQLQLCDDVLAPVVKAMEKGDKPDAADLKQYSLHTNRLFALWDQLTLVNSVLYCKFWNSNDQVHLQLVAPRAIQRQVLDEMHGGSLSAHLGEEKTLHWLKQKFYWPGHFNDVRNWCRNCPSCAASKTLSPKAKAELKSVSTGNPTQMVAADIMGPLPESEAGNSYLLVVGDYFTHWMEAFPIPNQEAITFARILVDRYFCRFGIPEQLHSDQGKQFESALFQEVCKILRIEKTRTTPYHPQSDGLVERYNRTLKTMLTTCTDERPFDWESYVPKVCMAYNTSVHSTTGYTPHYLPFGQEARLPVDCSFPLPVQEKTVDEYAVHLSSALNNAYFLARDKMQLKQNQQRNSIISASMDCLIMMEISYGYIAVELQEVSTENFIVHGQGRTK